MQLGEIKPNVHSIFKKPESLVSLIKPCVSIIGQHPKALFWDFYDGSTLLQQMLEVVPHLTGPQYEAHLLPNTVTRLHRTALLDLNFLKTQTCGRKSQTRA